MEEENEISSFLSHHQTVKLHLPEHKKLVDIETKQEINAQEIEMRSRSMSVIQMLKVESEVKVIE